MARLDKAVAEGKISVYYRRVIVDMSKKVLEVLARRYEKVQKGVKEIMGGRVLEHEGKTILSQGIAQGLTQGIAIGEERTLNAAIEFMRSNGMSSEQIDIFRALVLKSE